MKPYIEYLAEETGIEYDVQTALRVGLINQKQIEAAADKFAEDRMAAFAEWISKKEYIQLKSGKWRPAKLIGRSTYKTTSELIAIFNSETNGN